VVRGERVVVDLATGVSRVESGGTGGVRALIQSGGGRDGKPEAPAVRPAPKSTAPMALTPAPSRPSRTN
jgi:lipopolysaccharide export system protein LptA